MTEPPEASKEETARPYFDSDEFEDFSLTRVVLAYGLPTLVAVLLATVCFCYRDL